MVCGLCRPRDLACRLGTRGGAAEIKAHPFFAGVQWDRMEQARAPNVPSLKGELDTSNFENFDEMEGPAGGGRRRANRKDPDFMCAPGCHGRMRTCQRGSERSCCGDWCSLTNLCTVVFVGCDFGTPSWLE